MGGAKDEYQRANSGEDGDQLRKSIKKVAKAQGGTNFGDEGELCAALLRRKVVPDDSVDLLADDCSYSVDAVKVGQGGLGLEDYGSPLNHGLIQVYGLGEYTTIEMNVSQTPQSEPRRMQRTYNCDYVAFANLLVQGFKYGSGSLYSIDKSFSLIPVKYKGWVHDCWARTVNVTVDAGLTRAPTKHEEDIGQATAWLESRKARGLVAMGRADTDRRHPLMGVDGED